MAAVTQCDVCNNVCKNEESMWLKVMHCNKAGDTANEAFHKDLCPECYSKLCKLIKQEVK